MNKQSGLSKIAWIIIITIGVLVLINMSSDNSQQYGNQYYSDGYNYTDQYPEPDPDKDNAGYERQINSGMINALGGSTTGAPSDW
jgi:hypothetical protein